MPQKNSVNNKLSRKTCQKQVTDTKQSRRFPDQEDGNIVSCTETYDVRDDQDNGARDDEKYKKITSTIDVDDDDNGDNGDNSDNEHDNRRQQ